MTTPPAGGAERPLDDQIAELTTMCAEATPTDDRAGLAGLLGDAHLERYGRDGAAADLAAGIRLLRQAADAGPIHADRLLWYEALGVALAEQGDAAAEVASFEESVAWLGLLWRQLAEGERDAAAALLAQTHWDLYYALLGREPDRAGPGLASRLVEALDALVLDDPSSEAGAYVTMLRGLAWFEHFRSTDKRADLDKGVELVALAWPDLSAATPRCTEAGVELMFHYLAQDDLDGGTDNLDRAMAIGDRLGDVVDDEDLDRYRRMTLATGYGLRWRRDGDPGDAGGAVDAQRVALSGADDAVDAWCDQAIDFLKGWPGCDAAGGVDAATDCVAAAFAAEAPDLDTTMRVYGTRAYLVEQRMRRAERRADGSLDSEVDRLCQWFAEAVVVLDDGVDASPNARSLLAANLALNARSIGEHRITELEPRRLRVLVELARQMPDPPPEVTQAIDLLTSVVEYLDSVTGLDSDDGNGVASLAEVIAKTESDADRLDLGQMMAMFKAARDARNGRVAATPAPRDAARRGRVEPGRMGDALAALMAAMGRAMAGDPGALREAGELAASIRVRPADYGADAHIIMLVDVVANLAAAADGSLPSATWPPVWDPATAKGELMMGVAPTILAGMSAVLGAAARHDRPVLRAWVDYLLPLAEFAPTGHSVRFTALGLVATALQQLGRGDRVAAADAAATYERVLDMLPGTHHPMWAQNAMGRAEALRRSGHPDRELSRRLGLSALEAHAWRAMVQSGTDEAMNAVRLAAENARTVAAWCIADDADDDLVAAVDAGRALALGAVTAARSVPERLRSLGEADLADEWSRTAGRGRNLLDGVPLTGRPDDAEVPDDLRVRALHALRADTPLDNGLLAAPATPADIRAALARTRSDALVYLVPSADHPGYAVVVPASGPVERIPLAGLSTNAGTRGDDLLSLAAGSRDAGPVGHAGAPRVSAAARLDGLCRWAWDAAMGELVARAARWSTRRPARLVLVPTGRLAQVPWHAARTGAGAASRGALDAVRCSYSVSARVFCTTARHAPQPIASSLVVGNPDGTLPGAGLEARAVHDRFYPDGAFQGRSAPTAGTPDDVLAWISAAAGPSVLHLACHAGLDSAAPTDGFLRLAGGDLTAGRLLAASAASELVLDRVFLAACRTGAVAGPDDEAISLASVFLVAGAHTVIGTLWAVPDEATSVFMYLVHHFMSLDPAEPGEALHRAQRWMLDPGRVVPDTMPDQLRARSRSMRLDDPRCWAAFVHFGR